MKSVALIGSNGFVGKSIRTNILNNRNVSLTCITRQNYEEEKFNKEYDIVINASMPSKRFWAKQNPYLDFIETIEKTFKIVTEWENSKIIQISSISARSQLNTIYGRHKAAAEKLVENEKNLILRLGPMYGKSLNKGVLIDMKNHKPVYVSEESLYSFAPVNWVGNWIANNLHLSGILDLGSNDNVRLGDIAKEIGSNSIFQGPIDNQIISKEIKNAPKAKNVIKYMLDQEFIEIESK